MRTFLRVLVATARRELLTYALSPISYLLGALFLVVEGYSFWLLCQTLSATRSSESAVLGYFFGGTLLYWLFLLFLVSLLTMRLFAEERQRGSLDLLLSLPAPEGALLLGKFIGALGFYLTLWLPTLAYVALLSRYLGPQASLDLGPLLGGYFGTLLSGISALALGVLMSALAPTSLIAAALTFVTLVLLLLGGLVADLSVESPLLAAALSYCNLFQHMDELARGILDSRRVVYHLALAVCALAVAARYLKTRTGDRPGLLRTAIFAACAFALFVGVNLYAARHPHRTDLTRSREHALSAPLLKLLSELKNGTHTVEVTVLHAELGGRDELFLRLRETLLQAEQAAGERLHVTFLDVDRHRDRARLFSERFHIERDELQNGVVIVESGGHNKLIFRNDLGALAPTAPGEDAQLADYRGEEAVGSAILTVTAGRTPTICFPHGHGEAEFDSFTGSGLSDLSTALTRENLHLQSFDGDFSVCDVVFIAGPERPFVAAELEPLARYLDGGGRLFVLSGALLDRGLTRFLDTGLEDFLKARGVKLEKAVALDPPHRLGDSLAFVVDSYGEHAITAGLAGRKTLWPLARPVLPLAPLEPPPPVAGTGHSGLSWRTTVLATTGPFGFAETDFNALRDGKLDKPKGAEKKEPLPIFVAAQPVDSAQKARIAVCGSTQMAWNDSMVLFNRDLLVAAVKWLADAPPPLFIAPRRPEEIRLALTQEALRRLFIVVVLGMPGLLLLLGIGVRFIRRGP